MCIPFCQKLSQDKLKELSEKVEEQDTSLDQIIFRQGQESDHIYVVKEGEYQLLKMSFPDEQLNGFLQKYKLDQKNKEID